MMKRRAILAVLAAVAAAPAHAEDWRFVASTAGAAHYIDADSIVADGSVRDLTLFMGYQDALPNTEPKNTYYVEMRMKIDCDGRKQANVRGSAFGLDHKLRATAELPVSFRPVQPQTAAAHYLDFVCTADRTRYDKVDDPFIATDIRFNRGG